MSASLIGGPAGLIVGGVVGLGFVIKSLFDEATAEVEKIRLTTISSIVKLNNEFEELFKKGFSNISSDQIRSALNKSIIKDSEGGFESLVDGKFFEPAADFLFDPKTLKGIAERQRFAAPDRDWETYLHYLL